MPAKLQPRDPAASVVSAPAGSGKTTLLLYHYLRHLQAYDIERIVAITFTRKAAAELTGRLAAILRTVAFPAECGADAIANVRRYYADVLPSPERARRALAALESAPVSTVDSFTLALVQEFLLHAYLPLSGGRRAYIDGPVTSGASSEVHYEAAARTAIDAMSDDARLVLSELTVGEAIQELVLLARSSTGTEPSAGDLLEALGDALRPHVRDRAWSTAELENVSPVALERARQWFANPAGRAPVAVLSWLGRAPEDLAPVADRACEVALEKLGFAVGACAGARALLAKGSWEDDALVERADALRAALRRLSASVRDEARRSVARTGALAYDDLLLAATELCRTAPPELASRYSVLMVDELQDTNPQQLAFYEAFAAMRPGARAIRTFYVGDARQSIYRFRSADPYGWRQLLTRAQAGGVHAELDANYRSSKLLVEAQRRIVANLRAEGERGLDDLDTVQAAPDAPEGLLDGERPIVVINGEDLDDVNEHVIGAFASRLGRRWRTEPGETAAVLTRSWAQAAAAVKLLAGHGIRAQLTGDRSLLRSRTAIDLRLLLRALLDTTDDVALLGVLKHPAVGVSDRGLLLLRGHGQLGRLFDPTAGLPDLPGGEGERLARTAALLREARGRMGRESTADVLEWLAGMLRWRPILHAGPEGAQGAGVAQLDVLLEVVRGWEADRVDPHAVALLLDPEEGGADDLPVIRMNHGPREVVEVTTVHAAKGLEYDHVALLGVHSEGSRGLATNHALVTLSRPMGVAWCGVRFDPRGAFERSNDPIAALGGALASREAREEGWRLFYVGLTRAKRSVTFGLRQTKNGKLAGALRKAIVNDAALAASCDVRLPDDSLLQSAQPRRRGTTVLARPLEARWAAAEGWTVARPSGAAERLDVRPVIDTFRNEAEIVRGPDAPPIPDVQAIAGAPEATLGQVVHGWLERWAFDGDPRPDAAAAYLRSQWGSDDPALAAWVVALGRTLRDELPGFRELLAQGRLHFEWPLVAFDGDLLWTGRADLVVELPGRRAVVLDFKAGSRFAQDGEIPGLGEYAPQLEAYRCILEAAGYSVVETGLVYVRGVSWVRHRLRPADSRAA